MLLLGRRHLARVGVMPDERPGLRYIARETDERSFYPILSFDDKAAILFDHVIFAVSATKRVLVLPQRLVSLVLRSITVCHDISPQIAQHERS
jgi:hypothetical protein